MGIWIRQFTALPDSLLVAMVFSNMVAAQIIEVQAPSLWWNLGWIVVVGIPFVLNYQLTRDGFLNLRIKVLVGLLISLYLYGLFRFIFVTPSAGGTIILSIGLALIVSPVFSNTAAVSFILVFLDPELDHNYAGLDKIKHFIGGVVKLGIFLGAIFYAVNGLKHQKLKEQKEFLRSQIARLDADIDTCDHNVSVALINHFGNPQQWRQQSAYYAEEKQKLEAQLSALESGVANQQAP